MLDPFLDGNGFAQEDANVRFLLARALEADPIFPMRPYFVSERLPIGDFEARH